ncbi:MAG TPA: preprotein translocase subunit SecY [Gemmatales bacterium]|nr:preprotein translocase subunit SecY [Gemmatales bacterium]HMP60051.1 preprotein translocase subunit SecY [Gemmatales bacterium]
MNTLVTIFKIPELTQKIVITLIFLAVYRIGYHIPLPIVDQNRMLEWAQGTAAGTFGQLFTLAATFSGSNLGQRTIFGLGIMPYISASIIFQLLANFWPPLEKLQKEGESGRKKINEYTRYATVPICFVQSWMLVNYDAATGLLLPGYEGFFSVLAAVVTMTAGTMFLMWVGEQIDEYGIGNGISLIIMAGIVARIPEALKRFFFDITNEGMSFRTSVFQLGSGDANKPGLETLVMLAVLFLAVVVFIIAMTKAHRRIPTQSARHVRGRRVMGGQRQFLPLKLNTAGVMPVIFASSLLMLPFFIFSWITNAFNANWSAYLASEFVRQGFVYNLFSIVLIFFFTYFWTGIAFNPKEVSNNLRDYGSFIPGYRPGRRTGEYLEKVMNRLTFAGATFLCIVAITPSIIMATMPQVDPLVASFYGGTGLLIMISVSLDLVQKINSHLVMRNYPGLTDD